VFHVVTEEGRKITNTVALSRIETVSERPSRSGQWRAKHHQTTVVDP